ncbi:MAG TPA: KH domain-containing protein [Solirubrobacteraceae bacterium]
MDTQEDSSDPGETPRQLLEYLAEGLVDEPEEVSVDSFEEDDGTIVLELCVADGDYGKVIGRGGRTAHALRTVVKASATGAGRRVLLDIVD